MILSYFSIIFLPLLFTTFAFAQSPTDSDPINCSISIVTFCISISDIFIGIPLAVVIASLVCRICEMEFTDPDRTMRHMVKAHSKPQKAKK